MVSRYKTHLCSFYIRGEGSYLWDQKLSVRTNQDNQREYEERAVRRMAAMLTRRTCADSPSLYARMHSHSHGYHGLHAHSVWNSHIIPQGKFHLFAVWAAVNYRSVTVWVCCYRWYLCSLGTRLEGSQLSFTWVPCKFKSTTVHGWGSSL